MKRILLEITDEDWLELCSLFEEQSYFGTLARIKKIWDKSTVRNEDFMETSEWGQRNPDLQAEVNRP